MSPRAAWRLETLGFGEVYDYAPGKADWAATGRPTEGELASVPRIGSIAHRDVPTCSLTESVEKVAERTRTAGWYTCIAVNEHRVVLGRLFRRELDARGSQTVEEAMRSGPSTFRPNVTAHEMMHFMDEHDLRTVLVTTWEGTLVGLVRREDLGES